MVEIREITGEAELRHRGYGGQLVKFACDYVVKKGGAGHD